MGKREGGIAFIALFLIVLMAASASAVNETNGTGSTNRSSTSAASSDSGSDEGKIDKAYACLENLVEENNKLSLQEAVFSMLALGATENAEDKIADERGNDCWPEGGCKLKETAQAALAYNRVGKDTGEIEDWINSKSARVNDLVWYLQIDIDNHVASNCNVKYDGRTHSIDVEEDMRISGGAGSCLTVSSSGYWLRIAESCMDEEFEVSCDQNFITSLLYQKTNGQTVYVSSETHSAASLGTTKEQVKAKCLKTGSACDYEGSLWAVYALSKLGNEVSDYVPYLLAMAEDNKKYFPEAWIYMITGGDDQYSEITQGQKQNKYWEVTENKRFYDTATAMLALQSSNAPELDNAQEYLLGIQGESGCWDNNNIRNTAFLLYSGWPKRVSSGGGSTSTTVSCTSASAQYSCARASDCIDAGGQVLYNYDCSSANQFCCSVRAEQQTCDEKRGLICTSNQECSGATVSSLDGSCCMGSCLVVEEENVCEDTYEGQCKSSCGDDEDEVSASCGESSQTCCIAKAVEESSSIWIWVILLIILIALIAVAIIYRDRLRIWWFGFRGRFKSSNIPRSGPSNGPAMRPRAQFIPRGMGRTVMPANRSIPRRAPRDPEMEETFKKLKEMSK